eukprot:8339869-Pyramimonas_sp.AAC.1
MYPRKDRSVEAQGGTVLNGLGAMSIEGGGSNGSGYMDELASSKHSRQNSPLTWITSSTYLVDATVVSQDCPRRTNP